MLDDVVTHAVQGLPTTARKKHLDPRHAGADQAQSTATGIVHKLNTSGIAHSLKSKPLQVASNPVRERSESRRIGFELPSETAAASPEGAME